MLHFHRIRLALLSLMAVALVATGWSHRVPQVPQEALAFMVATGASTTDICGDVGPGVRHADPLCQACQIAGGADLPERARLPQRLVLCADADGMAPSGKRIALRVLDLSRAPQGPPVA